MLRHQAIQMQNCRIALKLMRLFFIALLFLSHLLVNAQKRCGTEAKDIDQFEEWISEKILTQKNQARTHAITATVYEIPVVIHVIERADGSNFDLLNDRIVRQIEILNEDFGRTNKDTVSTPPVFQPVAANTEIQFVLAKQDPNGNPTNGIVRLRGSKNSYSVLSHKELLRYESYWSPEHYLNMYVLDTQSFLGFASFPVTSLDGVTNRTSDFILDGILIDYQYFGENSTTPTFESFGRTATHEVGHYLGLRHIWGDGDCRFDDFVADTPVADKSNLRLSSPCTFPSNDNKVCSTAEMFQNYMDFTDDVCMNLFTEGQKIRMRRVLENSPRRTTLVSSPALTAPVRFKDNLAVMDINTPKHFECSSSIVPSIQVINLGNNPVTSYDIVMSIDGSQAQLINKTTSLDEFESENITFSPELIATTPADIKYTISNVNGTTDGDITNNTKTISLSGTSSVPLPFYENFESSVQLLGNVGASFPWEIAPAPKEVPTNHALQLKAFQSASFSGENAIIKTPVFDLTEVTSGNLIFSYSHAVVPQSFYDGLAIKVSTDCGEVFSDVIFNSYGPDLSSAPETPSSFIPQNSSEWRTDTISLTPYRNMDGVQFAFVGQSGGGNNIYLDDISIIQTILNANDVSIKEVDAPLSTCKETVSVSFRVKNDGLENVTSLTYQYTIGRNTVSQVENNLSIPSGESQNFSFDVNLIGGFNEIEIIITQLNESTDDDTSNNTILYTVDRELAADSYPLLINFETPNFWNITSPDATQIWGKSSVGSNGVLLANAFSQNTLGIQSWFISPPLNVGEFDSAGLSFKVSYATRGGSHDKLQVLMSVNCGESYPFELLNASSDSLAVTESNASWIPSSDADWKEFEIDLKPSIIWQDNIKIAFVFTNGNGNNLYIDDINIGLKPGILSENSFVIYPNPANSYFNIAFALQERDEVEIQIMDISGKVIFCRQYENVLDQVYDFDPLAQSGFYFIKITGSQINKTEKLYIR